MELFGVRDFSSGLLNRSVISTNIRIAYRDDGFSKGATKHIVGRFTEQMLTSKAEAFAVSHTYTSFGGEAGTKIARQRPQIKMTLPCEIDLRHSGCAVCLHLAQQPFSVSVVMAFSSWCGDSLMSKET